MRIVTCQCGPASAPAAKRYVMWKQEMKNIGLSGILLLLLALVTACSHTVRLTLPEDESFTVRVSEKKDILTAEHEYQLIPADPARQQLSQWFNANREGWSSTPASYLGDIVVRGRDFTLQFAGSQVIVNYRDGQYIKAISPSEYQFLKR